MKLKLDQLAAHLSARLAPVYLISGDEPLQVGEAADAIRESAHGRGFESRELFYVEGVFDWGHFLESAESMSLFGDRRILDLRIPDKPNKDATEALERYSKMLPDDAVLIVSLPKLSAAEQKARWFQQLESAGVFVQVWPLEGQQLIAWLDRRMGAKKMLADRSGLGILAARVEGNLLAAAQEIEKLHILYGSVRVDDDMIRKAVADSARYDVYGLSEAALLGQAARSYRILGGLRAEGVAPAVALWSLSRDLRLLVSVRGLMDGGASEDAAFARQKEKVWDKRRTSLSKGLQRLSRRQAEDALLLCGRADRAIKGQDVADPWDALLDVCLAVLGKPVPAFLRAAA